MNSLTIFEFEKVVEISAGSIDHAVQGEFLRGLTLSAGERMTMRRSG